MSDDQIDSPYTPDERRALRNILRDPAAVKDLFNQNRDILSKALEQMRSLRGLNQNSSTMDDLITDVKTRLDLNDTIEALVLNEIQLRDLIKAAIDAVITKNSDRLKTIRQQLDK